MATALHSSGTYLYHSTDGGTNYTKLIPIKTVPQLGSEPALLETTTLDEKEFKTYIKGLQDMSSLSFTANYNLTDWKKIIALTGIQKFEVRHGDDGANGKWQIEGEITAYKNELSVDAVQEMTVVIVPHKITDPSGVSRMRSIPTGLAE